MRKIVASILTITMLFALTACGNSAAKWQEQYDLGVRYLSEGNYEEAIIAFTAAIEIDSKRPEAYVGRGNAYLGNDGIENNLNNAQTDFEKAIELHSTDPDAFLKLAEIYIRNGENEKAQETLQKGIDLLNDQRLIDSLDNLLNGRSEINSQLPFSLQDLEDWGYPHGMSAYEALQLGYLDYSEEDLNWEVDFLKRNPEFQDAHCGHIYRESGPRLTFAELVDLPIYSADIFESDVCNGPRGIAIGMSAEEVIQRFPCDDAAIIEHIKLRDKEYFNENGNALQLYQVGKNGWYDRNDPHGSVGKIDTDKLCISYSCENMKATLSIIIENWRVTNILVQYNNE